VKSDAGIIVGAIETGPQRIAAAAVDSERIAAGILEGSADLLSSPDISPKCTTLSQERLPWTQRQLIDSCDVDDVLLIGGSDCPL
jgi:hypothetical protein